jgi:transposase
MIRGVAPGRMSIMMETMGTKGSRRRRSFTNEFKAEVVALVRQLGNSVGSVSRDLDLTETAVRGWVKQADIDDGHRDGLATSEREELARLRRENRRLSQDVEILKRATAFFAKETR